MASLQLATEGVPNRSSSQSIFGIERCVDEVRFAVSLIVKLSIMTDAFDGISDVGSDKVISSFVF